MEELGDMREVLLWDERDATGQTWRSCSAGARRNESPWIDDFLTGNKLIRHNPRMGALDVFPTLQRV